MMKPTLSALAFHPFAFSCPEPVPPKGWKSMTSGIALVPV